MTTNSKAHPLHATWPTTHLARAIEYTAHAAARTACGRQESTKAFFYSSVPALQWTQRLMLRLWAYLISQVDSMAYRYQPTVFETLCMPDARNSAQISLR